MPAQAGVMKNQVRNAVVHFEVLGRDASALRKFYSEAFGWELGPADSGPLQYSMVHTKEGSGGIDGGIGKAPQGPGHVTFYIGVDDAEGALKQVEQLGGKTIQPPVQLPGGVTFALFADPEGHVVGLVKE
jgi:predicted enzyme related to lactoylglutathione lyase